MRAILLSAGQGTRLMPLTAQRPKCLLAVRGHETLLDLQLDTLAACGVHDVTVMTGFGAGQVDDHLRQRREWDEASGLRVDSLFNPLFDEADNLVTCWVARSRMCEPFLLLNGDTVCETAVLEHLLASAPAPLTLAVNQKASYDADDMKVTRSGSRLCAVGKTLPLAEVDAESIGLMVFRGQGPKLFREILTEALRKPDAVKAWYLSAVDALAKTIPVETVSITGLRWWEVDTHEDLDVVRRALAPKPAPSEKSLGGCLPKNGSTSIRHPRRARSGLRIGLLNNLRAGRNHTQVARLLHAVGREPEVVHVETSQAQAAPEALAELERQDVDLLVVNGGDGTLQHALTEIFHGGAFEGRVPLIAPLRGGRTNMTALDLGMRRDSVYAVKRLIEMVRKGDVRDRVVERPVLRVRHGPGRHVRYGMFFGAGVIHRGIELVHAVFPKERQGVLGASLVTAALLARMGILGDSQGVLTPDKIGIFVDRLPVDRGESSLVMATSLDRLFLRMRPFWGTGPGGVRFTAIASAAPGIGRALPGILAGHPGKAVDEDNGYLSRNASRVDLRMDCGFTVDGELVEPAGGRIVSITGDDVVRFVRA
jgi:choline kinase